MYSQQFLQLMAPDTNYQHEEGLFKPFSFFTFLNLETHLGSAQMPYKKWCFKLFRGLYWVLAQTKTLFLPHVQPQNQDKNATKESSFSSPGSRQGVCKTG